VGSTALVAVGLVGRNVFGAAFVSVLAGGGWTLLALAVAVVLVHVATAESSSSRAV